MKTSFIRIILVFAVLGMVGSCKKDEPPPPKDLSDVGHPRILLLDGEEQKIHDLIEADETWNKMHLAILEKSTSLLGKPVLERVMVGRRLLNTSRELLKRIFYLSYAVLRCKIRDQFNYSCLIRMIYRLLNNTNNTPNF